jgi:hypothetical protein
MRIGKGKCNERIALLQILEKLCMTMQTGFIWLKMLVSGGFL